MPDPTPSKDCADAPSPGWRSPRPRIFTREAIRELDRRAVEQYAITSIVLMENAGRGLAEAVADQLKAAPGACLILCGTGNNGGDGLVAARHLHNRGVEVRTLLIGHADRVRGDAAANLEIARRMGLPLTEAPKNAGEAVRTLATGVTVVIDAMLGTGLDRAVGEPFAGAIEAANTLREAGARLVSADLPSGLEADTGRPLGACIRADLTVTFVGPKAGFTSPEAAGWVGRVQVAGIGAPRALEEALGRPAGVDRSGADISGSDLSAPDTSAKDPPSDGDPPSRGGGKAPGRQGGENRGTGGEGVDRAPG